MMANSARDPYWQASVRREVRDHASSAAAIEHECSLCHMPMAHLQARATGKQGEVFANLGRNAPRAKAALAQDGVSCSVCHQIEPDNLGKPESFGGGFSIDTSAKTPRKAMGPFEVKSPLARLMASATTFYPTAAAHIRSSELCATCHTLITDALGPDGKIVGRLPEQVPFLEWLESAYKDSATCASCHMADVREPAPIASLLAEPRRGLARHEFLGGNFIVPTMLKLLGTAMPALPQDLDRASDRARAHVARDAAKLGLGEIQVKDGVLEAAITVENQAGHKLPTAYPSRRVWLHLTVKDGAGAVVFESGAIGADGKIAGNDNDEEPLRFEPHHKVIETSADVQIYEAILGDSQGRVTTGLLHAVAYLKDNRIVPVGFDKKTVGPDVAVRGEAFADDDFIDGSDRILLRVPVGQGAAPFKVEAELLYQPIGFRWAENLRAVGGSEPRAFSRAFDTLAGVSWQRMAFASGDGK
jgi:cytochrome c551/c552